LLARFGLADLEDVGPVDFLHRQKGSGHPAARAQELPAIQAQPLAVGVGQLEDAPLDALLRFALRRRQILAIRDNLGRYRRCGRSRLSALD
jgi:hypothetical protein